MPDLWELTDIHLARGALPQAKDSQYIEFTPGHDPFAVKSQLKTPRPRRNKRRPTKRISGK